MKNRKDKLYLYFLQSFYLDLWQFLSSSPNAPLFPFLTKINFIRLAQAENSRATVQKGVNPGLTFSKTKEHQRASGEIALISVRVCMGESEQMGQHTAQFMQVEGSRGTELTWRRTSRAKALGTHPVLSACVSCLPMRAHMQKKACMFPAA